MHVLLLNWKVDDIDTFTEFEELRDFFENRFAYFTEIWSIFSQRPENAFEKKLVDVKQKYENENRLIIVYYENYSEMNRNKRSVWAANLE